MKIRWSRTAIDQLRAAYDFIANDDPEAADRVHRQILEQVRQLATYPASGRQGRVTGTRELVIVRTPYIVAYRLKDQLEIQVLAILHGKRRWPKRF